MSDINQVLSQLKPCDTNRPYIFISYSSDDQETVWRDALQFQQDGYNVWLDKKNLTSTKDSWKADALEAIKDRDCKLVLFYVSASSLCSDACLRELSATTSEEALIYHKRQPVQFVAVDAEQIGNITDFYEKVFDDISATAPDKAVFKQKAKVLSTFLEQFFNSNNERVRIHPKDEPNRKGNYYDDIRQSLPDEARLFTPGKTSGSDGKTGEKDRPKPGPNPGPGDLQTVKTLSPTDIKYNICTFGSSFHIGSGVPVTLEMDGKRYQQKTHNTTKGRVDGLKQFYADQGLHEGDTLEARYAAAEHTIYLTRRTASNGLFQALQALRTRIAAEEKVPAYMVFSNAALWDMAAKQPRTAEEFLQVSGVGEKKADAYGAAFLREIETWKQENAAL